MTMRGNLFDVVLLPVLIVSFAVIQARRPQRQNRLWLCGWIAVMASFLVWMPVAGGTLSTVLDCVRLEFLVAGILLFISALVPETLPAGTMAALLLAPTLVIALFGLGVQRNLVMIPVVLGGELLSAWVARDRLRKHPSSPWVLSLTAVSAATMILMQVVGRGDDLPTWILVQEFLTCMLLLILGEQRQYAGMWMAAAGFATWALNYVLALTLPSHRLINDLINQLWNTPKHLVGIGLILIALEADTAKIQSLSEEYRLLYESNPQPMWIFETSTGRFLSVNQAAVRAYGYTRSEFLAMTLYDIRPAEDHASLQRMLNNKAFEERRPWRHRRKDGTVFEVECSGHDVLFSGRPARFIMAVDVSEQERINRELVYRAQHDPLTGLANRMLLEDRAQQMLARAARDGSKVALLTMDVDRFKQINDTFGHLVGDECLRAIASRLQSRVRDADTLARTGGEEFTVLVGSLTSTRSAQAAAAAFNAALQQPLKLSTNEIAVSMSTGVAVYPDDGETLDVLQQRSDSAMYSAKRMGGNRVMLANEEAALEARSAVDVEAALRSAITDSSLELYYQPIYDDRGRLARVEALVRGTGEYLQKAGPGVFIPIAEESGLILPLGNWVLDEACRQLSEWRNAGVPEFELAVNVSARQLVQTDFADRVLTTLERHLLVPRCLHLELTETTLMRDFTSMIRSMERLSDAGVRFSIDDFGTGYSSLARLSELPISTIKIDRSFVFKLNEGEIAIGIVRAIVHMSRHLKLEIVAEGVEEAQHIRVLRELGCDLFQGFYLGKPLPPAAMKETALRDSGVLPPFRESAAVRLSGSHRLAVVAEPARRPA